MSSELRVVPLGAERDGSNNGAEGALKPSLRSRIELILSSSYAQLLLVYAVLLLLDVFGVVPIAVDLVLFGVVLGLMGMALKGTLRSQDVTREIVWYEVVLVLLAFAFALGLRLWALQQGVPLGYDPGFHRFVFEHPFAEQWEKVMYPLPFLAIGGVMAAVVGADAMITWVFAIISAATVLAIWWSARRIFGRSAGIFAAVFFALSIAQYQTFWFNYYKNVIAIILLLMALPLFRRQNDFNWPLLLLGAAIAGLHQPALMLFVIGYACWLALDIAHWRSRRFGNEALLGAGVLASFVVLNADRVGPFAKQAFYVMRGIVGTATGHGTFFSVDYYVGSLLFIVPLAVAGGLLFWRRNPALSAMALCSGLMVFLETQFNLRMIIYFDIFVLLFAAAAAALLLRMRPVQGGLIVVLLCVAGVVAVTDHASERSPVISVQEFDAIRSINDIVEADAAVLVTDGRYIPWIKGYVDRKILSPGVLDDQRWSEKEWSVFWKGQRQKELLARMPRPLYIHAGAGQPVSPLAPECVGPSLLNGTGLRKVTC